MAPKNKSATSSAGSRISPATVVTGVVATWLIPGAGHWLLGRRGKAVLYFVLITFLYVLGLFLGDFRNVNPDRFPYHFLGEVLYGGATLPTMWLTQDLLLEFPRAAVEGLAHDVFLGFPRLDVGVLYCTVAGLLNVCVMVDVYESAYPGRRAEEG